MKKTKLLLLLVLLMAATGAWAQEQWDVVWDFTAWSTETVTALKADAAASKTEGWSDVEKAADAEAGADPDAAAKDNCFWFAGTVNEDGSLSANGVVIKELKGLKFNSDYAAKRSLAIAVNYPSTSLGDYAGGAYLLLGGGGSKQTCPCFTIPGVKAGSKITIEVESHKPSSARGIGLYKNSYAAENLIGEQFKPTAKEVKTWEIAEDCDVVVWNTSNCHIYTIKVKAPAAAAPAGFTVSLKDGVKDADKWTISPNPAEEGATVTVTYSGERKVKSVKAVKKDPSFTKVTTFSELQTALSAGKDVKLMNDIVCTAEIEITSDGALTIDGNGKTLSTTSAIRAFKVGSSATVAFKNLTFTGFVNGGGPAINNSGTIVLDGCTISNCHVNNGNGGGAIESSGKLYAINTTFSGNYSGEIGGAINNAWGSLYMSNCTFTNNYTTSSNAFYGGAIGINRGNEVRLINCSFSGNNYGTTAGPNDIGVFFKPTNYTIAGCTGATIAARSDVGDITTNTTGTATLDYSDLSNISFTYTPITVTWNNDIPGSDPYTPGGDPFSF